MQYTSRQYAIALKTSLDALGVPVDPRERSAILGKMLHITRHQAWSLLEGHSLPDTHLLNKISVELDL